MRGNDAGPAQLARVPGRRDGRMAVIVVKRKRRISRRRLHVLRLLGRRADMMPVGCCELLRRRPRLDAAGAAIVADIRRVSHLDGLVVDVADRNAADVVDTAVVEKAAAAPIAAFIADAGIAEAVRNAAVEADLRTPIAL